MVSYWVKTPWWLKKLFPRELIWDMPLSDTPVLYLTFDDGPHPEATAFVLEQLEKHDAKASFFCIGKNVRDYSEVYEQILAKGHTTGNHTFDHLNGWKTDNKVYLQNIQKATRYVDTRIFRPPYGRIKISQARRLVEARQPWKIYMWDVLSGDFDMELTPEQCLDNVLENIVPGSIVVFHDSEKAWPRMSYVLPRLLDWCREKNWRLEALPKNN
jgi:peptidoglycan/xylan/chitin deacetylase (PgdA/CDA1 family)